MNKKIRGILVSYEGGEGSGKSSVHRLLKERFAKTHPGRFIFVNDPSSDTEELAQIRRLLLSKDYDYGKAAELMLYGAARAELVEKLIEPALAEGINVVSDRFYDSTTVYQGMLKGHDMMKLQAMNQGFCGNLVPDVTFLFDVDARTGLARSNGRLDEGKIDEGRWESMGLSVHERINACYRNLAMANGKRFHVLNSNEMTIGQMLEAVDRRICDMLVSRMTHSTYNMGTIVTEELWDDWVAMGLVEPLKDGASDE